MKDAFISAINKSYATNKSHIFLGFGVLNGETLSDARINIALSMIDLNKLIAVATASVKTRTLQLLTKTIKLC
jgi:hypothetical protein